MEECFRGLFGLASAGRFVSDGGVVTGSLPLYVPAADLCRTSELQKQEWDFFFFFSREEQRRREIKDN